MDPAKHQLNQAMRRLSEELNPLTAEELSNAVSIARLFRRENPHDLDSETKKIIDNLPSKHLITKEMSSYDLKLLSRTVDFVWKKITGEKLSDVERLTPSSENARELDGCYWLLPGEILVAGFNHYDAAKKHKGAICSLLNINPIVFEKHLAADPQHVIQSVIQNHGVRVLIKRDESAVYMQASETAWPLARNKLHKMYHRTKLLRVLDRTKPYRDWTSGIPLIIH